MPVTQASVADVRSAPSVDTKPPREPARIAVERREDVGRAMAEGGAMCDLGAVLGGQVFA